MRSLLSLLVLVLCAGCGTGAVVFAPTAAPPDASPLRYEHPSGAFALTLPRNWTVYTQNTAALVSASFAPPDSGQPLLTVAAVNLGAEIDAAAFGTLIDQYQAQVRPDVARYSEQNRQAMGDGSWRISGLRQMAGGVTQQVNTFIDREGSWLVITESVIPDSGAWLNALQAAVNTVTVNSAAPLAASDLSALAGVAVSSFSILNVATWTTAQGVFFVTGEVQNNTDQLVTNLPVRVVLISEDGLEVAEARDVVMGHGQSPGGFAPFSLRFGQGQPARSNRYRLEVGTPESAAALYGAEVLTWTDSSSVAANGQLIIAGTVRNCRVSLSPTGVDASALQPADCGSTPVRQPRVTVTVFDSAGQVIAAAFSDLAVETLLPGESAPYQIVISEMGGVPANYIVNVQGR
ncbi:MAG: hypothetical protein HXY40_07925 [Chloroflexi bacterium]|nr:hypothetical protein [Chloroflexota bacterium]